MNRLNQTIGLRWCVPVIAIVAVSAVLSCKNDSTGPSNDPGNLISNHSFEVNDSPSYTGWHFSDNADTSASDDVPVLGGSWSLRLRPEWSPAPYARAYITGESGRRVYGLSVWVKTTSLPEPAWIACGILEPDRSLRDQVKITITGTDWTQYSLQDTLDMVSTDTLVVELSPGAASTVPIDAEALFDLVRLQRVF